VRLGARLTTLEARLPLKKERVWRVFLTVPRPLYSLAVPCSEHNDCLVKISGPIEMHLAYPPQTDGAT
jgi:hypothetical protein